jgi:hypothetical protein
MMMMMMRHHAVAAEEAAKDRAFASKIAKRSIPNSSPWICPATAML